MKLREFKRLAQRTHTQAVIIGDGCRDYVVEIRHANGAGLLTDRRGRAVRARSLVQAKELAKYAGELEFTFRVAADEACAGESSADSTFSSLVLVNQVA